nr:MAG TPA: hypothetical protein [Bacteriophage sp.]
MKEAHKSRLFRPPSTGRRYLYPLPPKKPF